MSQQLINRLIEHLEKAPTMKAVANPYIHKPCSDNLRTYLLGLKRLPFSGHLLIGEAPGYRGCALTGIPFSSQRVLATSRHFFLEQLRPSLTIGGSSAESTATIVWGHLGSCDVLPALWNVFPFHPHRSGSERSNRKPTNVELEVGRTFIDRILEILTPTTVIAVGCTAQEVIGRFFPKIASVKVRHPSNGGKKEFISGLSQLGLGARNPC